MLPFSYAVRNLFRSKTRLLQTIGGSGLVVFLVMSAVAINQGMERVLSASGSAHNVILVGAGSEESTLRSEVSDKVSGIASASIYGVSETLGVRAISGEIHYMSYLDAPGEKSAQILIRGITPQALRVHTEVRLIDGHYPRAGEVMIGRLAHTKLGMAEASLAIGKTVRISDQQFRVAGHFAAPGTVLESEVWAPLSDLRVVSQRESLSAVTVRLDNPDDYAEADLFAKQRLDLELSALRESDYYGRLSEFFGPLRAMVWITAGLIAAGAVFGGLNTLYAAFASRVREMGTLQAIGFNRRALFISLVQESTLACLTGALIASAVVMLVLDGQTIPFSIGAFTVKVGPGVALTGIITGLLLGLVGAIPPAIRCLKPTLPIALRMS